MKVERESSFLYFVLVVILFIFSNRCVYSEEHIDFKTIDYPEQSFTFRVPKMWQMTIERSEMGNDYFFSETNEKPRKVIFCIASAIPMLETKEPNYARAAIIQDHPRGEKGIRDIKKLEDRPIHAGSLPGYRITWSYRYENIELVRSMTAFDLSNKNSKNGMVLFSGTSLKKDWQKNKVIIEKIVASVKMR